MGLAQMLSRFSPSAPIMRTHAGHKIFVDPANRDIRPCIANGGYYEPWVESALRRFLKAGHVVVEVGANHGYHTLVVCEIIGPKGILYSFEANPHIAKWLAKTIAANGYDDRVDLRVKAAGDAIAEVSFDYIPDMSGGGHISHGVRATQEAQIKVRVSTLDTELAGVPSVDLLRMDCEGYEVRAINGGWRLIDRSPTLIIVTEWCPMFMRAHGGDVSGLIGALESRGFRAWSIESTTSVLQPVSLANIADNQLVDVLLCRQDVA